MNSPRFAVDGMLGRLATWLRLLGCDAFYRPAIEDHELIAIARREQRLILTRDRRLAERRGVRERVCVVASDDWRTQLRQIVTLFGIDPAAAPFTRYLRCNTPLHPSPPQEVARRVPPYVRATQRHFQSCPDCGRIYWAATHRQRAETHLAQALAEPRPGAPPVATP